MNYKKNYQKCANLFKDPISVLHDLLKRHSQKHMGSSHDIRVFIHIWPSSFNQSMISQREQGAEENIYIYNMIIRNVRQMN